MTFYTNIPLIVSVIFVMMAVMVQVWKSDKILSPQSSHTNSLFSSPLFSIYILLIGLLLTIGGGLTMIIFNLEKFHTGA